MNPNHVRLLRESVAPYLSDDARASHTKLSISLPVDLVAIVHAMAADGGSSVSATIAAMLRRALDVAEQDRLDAALWLDADENRAWAESTFDTHARLTGELEW